MFAHSCSSCDETYLIFESQLTSLENTANGIELRFEPSCRRCAEGSKTARGPTRRDERLRLGSLRRRRNQHTHLPRSVSSTWRCRDYGDSVSSSTPASVLGSIASAWRAILCSAYLRRAAASGSRSVEDLGGLASALPCVPAHGVEMMKGPSPGVFPGERPFCPSRLSESN